MEMELSLHIVLFRPTADAVESQTHTTIPPCEYPLRTGSLLGPLDHVFFTHTHQRAWRISMWRGSA